MKLALYANGMIGGNDLTREIESIQARSEELRAKLLDSDQVVVEAEFAYEAPLPVPEPAEADSDGA